MSREAAGIGGGKGAPDPSPYSEIAIGEGTVNVSSGEGSAAIGAAYGCKSARIRIGSRVFGPCLSLTSRDGSTYLGNGAGYSGDAAHVAIQGGFFTSNGATLGNGVEGGAAYGISRLPQATPWSRALTQRPKTNTPMPWRSPWQMHRAISPFPMARH